MYKELISIIAIGLTLVAYVPYIRSIHRGETRPHVFSWILWGLTTVIVFFAQLAGHAGLGAWPVGVSGAISIYLAVLAYLKRGDTAITKSDWAFLFTAISALPFWFVTADPMWAVVILTGVDIVAFGPTFRTAYVDPDAESVTFFSIFIVRNILVILALEHYSLTTVLFPASVGLSCLLLITMILVRRRMYRSTNVNQS